MEHQSQSIHPRVVNGRTKFGKVNTAIPRRMKPHPETLANMEEHLRQNPKDSMTAGRLAKLSKM